VQLEAREAKAFGGGGHLGLPGGDGRNRTSLGDCE
jgi:hypothetical protein